MCEQKVGGGVDIVLLHVGTNDLIQSSEDTVQDVANNVGNILTCLRTKNPKVTVLLAKIIPLACDTPLCPMCGSDWCPPGWQVFFLYLGPVVLLVQQRGGGRAAAGVGLHVSPES